MNAHDKAVLTVCRGLLEKGSSDLKIGSEVKSKTKIVRTLKKEFPDVKIK